MTAATHVDRDPCQRCGTRADIGCRHRAASGSAPVELADKVDRRNTARPGNGNNFQARRPDAVRQLGELFQTKPNGRSQ